MDTSSLTATDFESVIATSISFLPYSESSTVLISQKLPARHRVWISKKLLSVTLSQLFYNSRL